MIDLKSFRKEFRLKQSDVAEALGCTQVHISCIESGTRRLTESQLSKMYAIYGRDSVEKFLVPDDFVQNINITKMSGNGNNIGSGEINNESSTDVTELMAIIKEQTAQASKFQEHIDRLLTIIEKLNG